MEEASKSIHSLAKHILPIKPHCLSISATRRYRPHPDQKRLEEQDIRPLQYETFVSDADRGVTLTRAYFDIREEPTVPSNATNAPTPRTNSSKPVTKLTLKDYKNRKAPDAESPSNPRPQPNTSAAPKPKEAPIASKHAPEPVAKDMESQRDTKKGIPTSKPEAARRRSPSPERKKRVATAEEESRPVKRIKGENSTSNPENTRPSKAGMPHKVERYVSHEKKPSKDLKPTPNATTNGKSVLSNLGNHDASPKPAVKVNGSQKPTPSNHNTPKKSESSSQPKSTSVPPLLSPLRLDGLDSKSEEPKANRPSPKKRPEESSTAKPQSKKPRDDREPSPSPKKHKAPLKIPPLLSPTLPPIVMEELAKMKTTPSKDSTQRSSQVSDSPQSAQKTVKPSKKEETIHVDSKKEGPERYVVTVKYKKRVAKTIERLLALPPEKRRKAEGLKKDDRAARDRSDSLEPGIARKRPRAATEAHSTEAVKRPRTSENLQPSTPLPKQSASMTRVTSSSSVAGTPGMATNHTPATQHPPPEPRRPPADPEQVNRLLSKAKVFRDLGTKLKHERDAIMRRDKSALSERDHYVAMGAGTQSLLAYMLGFKLEADARDLEKKNRAHLPWKELIPLFRVIRTDCGRHNQISALLVRIQGICLVYLGRALWSYPDQPEAAKDLFQNSKDQQETWRLAEKVRKGLGVYDGSSGSDDGGSVGKLIDRLGPWTSPEEAAPITLEVLRRTIRANNQWKPADELARVGHSTTNGISN